MSQSGPQSLSDDVKDAAPLDIYHDESLMILRYIRNFIRAVEATSKEANAVADWLVGYVDRFGIPDSLDLEVVSNGDPAKFKNPRIHKAKWRAIAATVDAALQASAGTGTTSQTGLAAGLRRVAAALGLDPLDTSLFEITFLYRVDNCFERLFDAVASARGRRSSLRRYPDMFALFSAAPLAEVNLRFRADSQLLISGAISIDEDGDISLAPRLQSLVQRCAAENCDVRTELLGKPLEAKLPFSAFRHLGREIEVAFAILPSRRQRCWTCWPPRSRAGKALPAPSVLPPPRGGDCDAPTTSPHSPHAPRTRPATPPPRSATRRHPHGHDDR